MKWFVMEQIERSHALFTAVPFNGFCDMSPWGIAESLPEAVILEKEGNATLMFPKAAFHQSGKAILEKVLQEPQWAEELNETIIPHNAEFFDASEQLYRTDWSAKDNTAMARSYADVVRLQVAAHTSGIPWVVLEFDHALLTNYLLEYVKSRIQASGLKQSAGEAFSLMTTPTQDSFAQKEEESLLRIAASIQDVRVLKLFESDDPALIEQRLPKMQPDVALALEEHCNAFAWLPYMYEGPAWAKAYFIQVLQGLLKQDVTAMRQKNMHRHSQLRQQQLALMQGLDVDAKHRQLLQVAQGLVFTKAYRKDCLYHFFYCLEPFLKEAAKRFGLTLRQIRRFTPDELVTALKAGIADADELNRRWQGHIYHVKGKKVRILTGKEADAFMKKLDVEKPLADADVRQLVGDCACPGFAKGTVRRIERPADMPNMQKGDVLVAHATNPDIVPAMKIAAAIVTDMGGITCHAAIVSRELKIPCVIGTKVATSVLKEGELVEVDATHGRVTKIGVEGARKGGFPGGTEGAPGEPVDATHGRITKIGSPKTRESKR